MNGKGRHFQRFKRAHKHGMAVGQIDTGVLTAPNGNGHEHLPDKLPTKFVWRERLRKIWAYLVVKNTDDGTYRLSKGTAGLFISAFLGVIVLCGLGLLWQRDELVRLRTIQEIQDKTNADLHSKVDQARNFATIADKNAARLEGKFDQFALMYGIKNAAKHINEE